MSLRTLTRRVRRGVPSPVNAGLRRTALAWGMATSRWRMQPDLVVVGAQRCGTTTLFRLLADHPDVVRPTLSKGTGYFDDSYRRGPRWYAGHFPLAPLARLRTRGRRPLTFEVSGYYLHHPLAAERIAHDLPGVKVVVMVRNPVDRAHSAHRHEQARGFDDLSFDEALAAESARTAGEEERLAADPDHTSHTHRHHAYVARGEYARQIRRYVELLGADRVRVVEVERFYADPVAEFARLQEWLGLRRCDPDEVPTWNARPRDALPAPTRAALDERFSGADAHLAELLGRPPVWREAGAR